MNIPAIVSKAVGLADRMFGSLQAKVVHEQWISHKKSGGGGKFDPGILRDAIVDEGAKQHRLPNGDEITTKAYIIFLEPVPPHGAEGRIEPFDPRDRITLPDQTTGLVVDVGKGVLDPRTGHGFLAEIWIA